MTEHLDAYPELKRDLRFFPLGVDDPTQPMRATIVASDSLETGCLMAALRSNSIDIGNRRAIPEARARFISLRIVSIS